MSNQALPEIFVPGGTPCQKNPDSWDSPRSWAQATAAADACMGCAALSACVEWAERMPPVGFAVQAGRVHGRLPQADPGDGYPAVSDGEFRTHLDELLASGMTPREISRLTGASHTSARCWVRGTYFPDQTMRRAVMRLMPLATDPAVDASHRVAAMHAAGMSLHGIYRATGVAPRTLVRLWRRQQVWGSSVEKVLKAAMPEGPVASGYTGHVNCPICEKEAVS